VLEGEAVGRAAALAEVARVPVYIVHVSSAPALAAVRSARDRGIDVLAETCPQYLHLDASGLEGPEGQDFVCTPPLRDPWHAEELWEGLTAGTVHTVATDHCPFAQADRRAGTTGVGWHDFTEIPGGLPGIETRLALVWDGVRAGRISVGDWVRLCAEAPARTFGLWPAKGSLAVGSDADVVVWDPGSTPVRCTCTRTIRRTPAASPSAGRCTCSREDGWWYGTACSPAKPVGAGMSRGRPVREHRARGRRR